ncbi:MAG: histidine kinase [Gallionellales bacterium RBG_16_57_15]|nr:MAG: histidine kinase [Gallionellales bacterium RBG_16_57_15]
MTDKTILLVDDEENITSALFRLLRRDGYKILRANSGKEGLELLAQQRVGVIISDQRMPGMTGTEFLTKVREIYPDTIRMVLSGYTELNSVTDAINRGAVYKFLTKPWEDDLLRANVEEAFQRYEMKLEKMRLTHELLQANDELKRINQELEQRVERKAGEIVHELKTLQISKAALEILPVAVIGIDGDGLIVIANKMASRLFSTDGTSPSLLGAAASTVLPADMLACVSPEHRQLQANAQTFSVAGRDVRCWCRSMGASSHANDTLLVIDAG